MSGRKIPRRFTERHPILQAEKEEEMFSVWTGKVQWSYVTLKK
jgi:hypothetical protein